MKEKLDSLIFRALDAFQIEIPSWGFANTGTRFGKVHSGCGSHHPRREVQRRRPGARAHRRVPHPGAARSVGSARRRCNDVGQVEQLSRRNTECAPVRSIPTSFRTRNTSTVRSAIPIPPFAARAIDHMLDCVEIAEALGCRDISPWFADGSNYPGTQSIRKRIGWFEEALQGSARPPHAQAAPAGRIQAVRAGLLSHRHRRLGHGASSWRKHAGPQACVLVDTGHHYQAQNIEQIVAWLLHHDMLGGFHFNDRRYADDDLTLGSIDPYQVFRIFHEIHTFECETGERGRHRLHGRPEPQPERQDRSHDPDRLHRAGTVRESRAGGS